MTAPHFTAPSWSLANTLRERRATPPTTTTPASRRGTARFQRWREQLPFRDGDLFAQRLATDALTETELVQLLSEPAEVVAERGPPGSWCAELEHAYAGLETWPSAVLPDVWREVDNVGFLDLIAPVLARGRARVQEGVRRLLEQYPQPPFDPTNVEDILLAGLPNQLLRLLGRTLILELHVAKLRGQLSGDTAEQRFASFVGLLRTRATALAILGEYPVLARQVVIQIEHWANYALEFLGHLCADWQDVQTLLPAAPGPLASIAGNAGDTHREGRAVLIAGFQSGARVVYKPKAMSVDVHFQQLLAWVNDQHVLPELRLLGVINRGHYGWVEFVAAGPCETPHQIHRFYQRQGGYLALLYALEATDLHSENLLAVGEQPILPDLESLFHPRAEGAAAPQVHELGYHALNFSVLRVGMLPRLIWANADSAGMDISGMGGTGGQLSPHRIVLLEGVGTDAMHLVRQRIELDADQNRPTLNGAEIKLTDYTDDIVIGFEAVYRLLLQRRDELLAPGGKIGAFAADEIRAIIRETRTYTMLLYESYHPDVLRDALDRDKLVDRLWVGTPWARYLTRVIPSERADLLRGDIPMYTTRANSRDLWSSSDDHLPDFFTDSGLDLVERRLRGFSAEDLVRQCWIVRASLATTDLEERPAPVVGDAPPTERDALVAAAVAVGNRLEELALRGNGGASWLGLKPAGKFGGWNLVALAGDLGHGLPGVALFLAHLGRITGEERFTQLAQETVAALPEGTLRWELDTSIGGFDGWGGVIYALAHLGTLWNRPELLAEAERAVLGLDELIPADKALDVISGSAGCIGGLLALHAVAPNGSALPMALRCGERLLAQAQQGERGVYWPAHITAPAPLTGFARGAAGIAWALRELGERSGETKFLRAAGRAIDFERALFNAEVGNWPDRRVEPASFSLCWGHGAPGIGLARLQALRYREETALRAEVVAALRTTLAGGLRYNHALDEGDLGNLEFVLQAAGQDEALRRAGPVLESMRREGWLSSAPKNIETPGLLTGLAGIGYGLLRLAEPARVPAVLVLAPPITVN